jgi:hypothetical protein
MTLIGTITMSMLELDRLVIVIVPVSFIADSSSRACEHRSVKNPTFVSGGNTTFELATYTKNAANFYYVKFIPWSVIELTVRRDTRKRQRKTLFSASDLRLFCPGLTAIGRTPPERGCRLAVSTRVAFVRCPTFECLIENTGDWPIVLNPAHVVICLHLYAYTRPPRRDERVQSVSGPKCTLKNRYENQLRKDGKVGRLRYSRHPSRAF